MAETNNRQAEGTTTMNPTIQIAVIKKAQTY